MKILGKFKTGAKILIGLAPFFAVQTPAAVLHVNSLSSPGGNGQTWESSFPKIQTAINTSVPGDEIWVVEGIYRETLQMRDGVSLFGGFSGTETNRSQRNWNIHPTILNGSNTNRVVIVPSLSLPTRLDGFVIQNGRADFGAGIYAAGGEFISANNLIIKNSGDGIFGGSGALVDETACFPAQTPITFFTNLANRLLQLYSPDLSTSRIQLYPTNRYTAEVHRSLQLAANIFDATTNRGASYPYFPSVFRPVFTNENGNIFISGFTEATDDAFLTNQWLALDSEPDRSSLTNSLLGANVNIFGQPIIIGAKKGFPNFNEFSIETIARVTRLLELRKTTTNSLPYQTNQMYRLSISNSFGVESWNSYIQAFPRPLQLYVSHTFAAAITDESGTVIWPSNGVPSYTNLVSFVVNSNWPGVVPQVNPNSFVLPYLATNITLPLSQYSTSSPHFQPASANFEIGAGFAIPNWTLNLTNRLQYFAVDSGRVVDFVNLDGVASKIELAKDLIIPTFPGSTEPTTITQMWNTNRLSGSTNTNIPTLGIQKQIFVSMGIPLLSQNDWLSYNGLSIPGSIEKIIAEFSKFMGLTPTIPGYQNIPMPTNLTTVAPFAPTRKIYHRISLQANDPLVHFQLSDLAHDYPASYSGVIIPPSAPSPPSNLKKLNDFCRPYPQSGFNRYNFDGANTNNPSFEDKNIGWSQDWNFPTGNCFNLQWLNKIHRGTPWQTIYTGSSSEPESWENWSGSAETNPTNDWKILEMFMAERNSLGTVLPGCSPIFVNNTFAANAGNNGAVSFAASATLLNNIVAENSSGLLRLPVTNEVILQTNCVFNNARFNYANLSNHLENLSANPQFVVAANGNFHLLATSPCVDYGNDGAFTSGWLLNEPARLQGAALDLGAFELNANDAPVFVSPSASIGSNQFTFQITGLSGESYIVETSDNLIQWIPISTNVTANGFFTASDPLDGATNRFYRAIHLP